jgi:hypothetical protein
VVEVREAYVARCVNLSDNRQSQESLQNKGPHRRNVSRRPSIGSCFQAILPHGYLGTPRNCEPHFSSMRCSNAGMCTCLILVLQFVSLVTIQRILIGFLFLFTFLHFSNANTQTRISVAFSSDDFQFIPDQGWTSGYSQNGSSGVTSSYGGGGEMHGGQTTNHNDVLGFASARKLFWFGRINCC